MGTWDDGLLDNDTSLDALGDLRRQVARDIERFGALKPSPQNTARLVTATGVLLQLSAYDFGLETDGGPKIVAALQAHAKQIALLPPAARKVLAAVAAGEGKSLAERPSKLSPKITALLHSGSSKSPFGKREVALFASKAAAAYVQEVAGRCVDMINGDFEDEDNWSDLCREAGGLGCLAVLLVLEPCRVPVKTIERWRHNAQQGLAVLEEKKDEELDFHRGYYRKLDAIFAVLVKRFSPR
jgi:hypothetical protein